MKRNSIVIGFLDAAIILLNKNKIYTYPSLSVNNYKVTNSNLFKKVFLNIITEQDLNKNILTDNVNVIIDTSYTIDEQEKLNKIFKELSFNEISFIYINDLLLSKEQELNVLVGEEFINIYYKDKTYPLYYYHDKLCETLDIYLKSFTLKYNIKTIKLFGNESSISKVLSEINIHGVDLYKYANPTQIPIIFLK